MPLHAWLARRHVEAERWKDTDADGDGLSLRVDPDPDGDGLDRFDDPDADGDGVANAADVVAAARALRGQPSDPLMGRYGDLLGRIGMRVCTDVVLDAWLAAGLSLPALLVEHAAAHPEKFEITAENLPADPFFARRVRNYVDLFASHPRLELDPTPRVGDLAFYGRWHAGIVTGVGDGYSVVEAYDLRIAERAGGYVERHTGENARFGRIRRGVGGR